MRTEAAGARVRGGGEAMRTEAAGARVRGGGEAMRTEAAGARVRGGAHPLAAADVVDCDGVPKRRNAPNASSHGVAEIWPRW